MEIDGEGIHHHHLDGFCTNDASGLVSQQLMIGQPRFLGVEVPFYAEPLPVLEFPLDMRSYRLGLKPERVAAEVDRLSTIDRGWNVEPGSIRS